MLNKQFIPLGKNKKEFFFRYIFLPFLFSINFLCSVFVSLSLSHNPFFLSVIFNSFLCFILEFSFVCVFLYFFCIFFSCFFPLLLSLSSLFPFNFCCCFVLSSDSVSLIVFLLHKNGVAKLFKR